MFGMILSVILWALALAVAGYYFVWFLAKHNVLWTIVEQGWCKIILHWGEYKRTVGPGRRWLGIPGVNTLYARKMTFFKSVTDSKGKPQAELHEDKDVRSFKTTDYAYAFPFMDEEDSHGLHLSGILAVIAIVSNYRKAFFGSGDAESNGASDWYSMMNTEIMPCFRGILTQISYDDDLVGRDTAEEQRKKAFAKRLWEALNAPEPDGGQSIVDKLFVLYGIKVKSVELRSVDPPTGWRDTTLAPYKAQREAAAAVETAKMNAEQVGGTILGIVARQHGMKLEDLENDLRANPDKRGMSVANGGYKETFAFAQQQVQRDRAAEKGELNDMRIGSTDGSPLPQGLQFLSVGGGGSGGAGMFFGGGGKGKRGGDQRGGKEKKENDPKKMDNDDLIDNLFGDKD